ncbi:hypothetical protein KP79_PYT03237 [Mizuhopecten yessoensis]|uniref:Uncharacterized protein n=1 Tax=Mizuhopecten yessoensis TaxID=6573 RepID=A0A210PIF0_MIZYE|nr:hypothetical protein KP79_PYT03237 [Mizuhopecten yessoensis]
MNKCYKSHKIMAGITFHEFSKRAFPGIFTRRPRILEKHDSNSVRYCRDARGMVYTVGHSVSGQVKKLWNWRDWLDKQVNRHVGRPEKRLAKVNLEHTKF